MTLQSEKIGLDKITFYPAEVYTLHYKGNPFTISKISLKEQWELGVRYTSKGTTTRKCYFTAGHAKTGLKRLPKSVREQVEIVKYVPDQEIKNKISEITKEHCNTCPCNYDCKNHNLDDRDCVIEEIQNYLNNFNIK